VRSIWGHDVRLASRSRISAHAMDGDVEDSGRIVIALHPGREAAGALGPGEVAEGALRRTGFEIHGALDAAERDVCHGTEPTRCQREVEGESPAADDLHLPVTQIIGLRSRPRPAPVLSGQHGGVLPRTSNVDPGWIETPRRGDVPEPVQVSGVH